MRVTLLDYGRPNPFGETIGGLRNLAWPVDAYRVTLPKGLGGDDGLNAFERVILKLLKAAGALHAEALRDETQIPIDLVKAVLLRLRDKGLIDEHNIIIQPGSDGRASNEEETPIFVTALVYRELVTGKILPFLHFLDESPLQKCDKERRIREINADKGAAALPPEPRDVIGAWRASKRRSEGKRGGDKSPTIQKVTIFEQAERYYLDCPIAIQKSDGEFRIADPFGNGFSRILESAFEQLLERDERLAGWLREWKKNSYDRRTPQGAMQRPNEPFDTDANLQCFPNLVFNLRKPKTAAFRSISTIYACIEWALFYACRRRSSEEAINNLQFSPQPRQQELLCNAAKSVRLRAPERGFKPIPEKKLQDFRNGEADFWTVLSIAVLQAATDQEHPLRSIALKHPDLIKIFLGMKENRDKERHGRGRAAAPKKALPEDELMREIVHSLLPEIFFAEAPANELNSDARANGLLVARDSIQGEFGFKSFNQLGANLQDRIIFAERFWISCADNDDALVFSRDLYAAVQSAFANQMAGKLSPDLRESEFISEAARKAARAGLGTALPDRLSTVKISFIRQSLQGSDQSLGACAIAFLLISDHETLCAVANLQPSFIGDIDFVLAMNRHGNEPLALPKADIAKLRKASYSTIKTLIEV
jgi:hypothetical protein